ncbi:hypothetical protein [Moraxella sp. ZY210820]|uniref:hypothetical protein n=1 Tax=unclassified Moraxella TaxID=2685852 RepID=UPI00272F59F9|nr:hypothetical protein [Moraxella sp. ZY210820]WLF83324.1 hypothetical protein LU301_08640 [Moraxella sp. ZY210820]
MSKKSSFAKKFPPLFIVGAVIGVLVVAYKYIFSDRPEKIRRASEQDKPLKTVNEPVQISHQTEHEVKQIEHKQ